MARAYNFGAGPAMLPTDVLERARKELLDWNGRGVSAMEMSHRGRDFTGIVEKAEADLRALLAIPNDYQVLFLQGGASLQFAMVPLNLRGAHQSADYVHTGEWSGKALAEGRRLGEVNLAASSEAQRFTTLPPREQWNVDPEAAYLHYTPNETIHGVEFHWIPDTGGVPLVVDMTSTLLSRPIDVSRFGVIYAGAQKQIGPAGLTVVILHEDLIREAPPGTPSLLTYKLHADNDSMLNTPPTFAWYLAGLVFQWTREQGGLEAMDERSRRRSETLYAAIDTSDFYHNPVDPACRSRMNVPFTLADPKLEDVFLSESEAIGLVALKGHRAVGGLRASLYNAMPQEGVDTLVEFMKDFEQRKA